MANLGEITEIVNSDEITLEVGSDNYILLTNLNMHIGRTENRQPTTDGGVLYTYGKGDHWFTATLNITTPEIDSLNTLTELDANGDMTSTSWKLVYKNISGATKTFAATGVLREFDISKGSDGVAATIDIFVRITGDTVTVS